MLTFSTSKVQEFSVIWMQHWPDRRKCVNVPDMILQSQIDSKWIPRCTSLVVKYKLNRRINGVLVEVKNGFLKGWCNIIGCVLRVAI